MMFRSQNRGRARRKSSRSKKGFSLLELLAVLVIMGIIVAMALGRFTKPIDSTNEKIDASNIRHVQALVERYGVEQGSYPSDMQDLVDAGYIDSATITGRVDSSQSLTFDAGDPYGTVRFD